MAAKSSDFVVFTLSSSYIPAGNWKRKTTKRSVLFTFLLHNQNMILTCLCYSLSAISQQTSYENSGLWTLMCQNIKTKSWEHQYNWLFLHYNLLWTGARDRYLDLERQLIEGRCWQFAYLIFSFHLCHRVIHLVIISCLCLVESS